MEIIAGIFISLAGAVLGMAMLPLGLWLAGDLHNKKKPASEPEDDPHPWLEEHMK